MTFSYLFKVTIIQREITSKWYNMQLYLQWPLWSIERRHFQWPWTTPTPSFKITPFFDAEYPRNGTTLQTEFRLNTNRDLHTPYSTASFRMTLTDLEWLSKIFNDTKRRAVSLRQLSFLFCRGLIRFSRGWLPSLADPGNEFGGGQLRAGLDEKVCGTGVQGQSLLWGLVDKAPGKWRSGQIL